MPLTAKDIQKGMNVIEGAVGKTYADNAHDAWLILLGDLDPAHYLKACARAALEHEFSVLPTAGLIRRLALESKHGVPIPAEVAFDRVRQAIGKFGFYQPDQAREFLGPAIWAAVRGIGGWRSVCQSDESNRSILFSQFAKAWNHLSETAATLARLPEKYRPPLAKSLPHVHESEIRKLDDQGKAT